MLCDCLDQWNFYSEEDSTDKKNSLVKKSKIIFARKNKIRTEKKIKLF